MLFKSGLAKDEDKAEEKKEDKKKEVPKDDIEAMLKSIGLTECIPKLKEKEIGNPEIFFELGVDEIIGALDIKTVGKKYLFKEKMKDIKEKHEKAIAKKEEEAMSEIVGETFEVLQKKSSIIF
jgi:hypothetical protein